MAVTHGTATRNALADQVDTQVNTGVGTAALEILATSTVLVSFNLPNPAFGAASGGTITMSGLPLSNTASATGTANKFQVKDRDGTVVFDGSVTATGGGGDMTLDNTSINSGQTVQIDTFTYTAPT